MLGKIIIGAAVVYCGMWYIDSRLEESKEDFLVKNECIETRRVAGGWGYLKSSSPIRWIEKWEYHTPKVLYRCKHDTSKEFYGVGYEYRGENENPMFVYTSKEER